MSNISRWIAFFVKQKGLNKHISEFRVMGGIFYVPWGGPSLGVTDKGLCIYLSNCITVGGIRLFHLAALAVIITSLQYNSVHHTTNSAQSSMTQMHLAAFVQTILNLCLHGIRQ